MALGALEFPGPRLVEDTRLSSSFWSGRDHAGLHAPGSALAALWAHWGWWHSKKGWVCDSIHGGEPLTQATSGLCKHRKRLENLPETQRSHKTKRCSCWPSSLAQEAHAPPPHTPMFFFYFILWLQLPCFIDLKIRLFFHLISVPFWGDAHNNYISCLISHDRGQTKVSSGLYFVLKPVKIGKELVFGGGGGVA